jgi:DNA repair exonuclease SbcCD ATPase subunit
LDIKLISLSLKNFKGMKEYKLEPNGQNVSVFGENATGKTTLVDARDWLLFDKDSTNRKDFSVKPQDEDGNDIHFLETEVEGIFAVDGQELKLRKMLCEKWVKKRGQQEQEFAGHETSYWIDDVPVKKNQYVKRIEELAPESLFKMLTNPYYFNTQVSWQDRRKQLMAICGDVSDAEVIQSDENLYKLTAILNGKSIDGYKLIIAERIKKLNQEIGKIPVRIDELNTTMLSSQIVDYTTAETGLADFKAELNAIEQELAGANDIANKAREKQQQLFKLERDIKSRKKELETEANAGNIKLLEEKQKLEMKLLELKNEQEVNESTRELKEIEIGVLNTEMEAMRQKYKEIFVTTFIEPDESNFVCPTCKRELPTEDIERQIKEMKLGFDTDKMKKLTKINVEGKVKKERKIQLGKESFILVNKSLDYEAVGREINERLAEIKQELTGMVEAEINYKDDHEYRRLFNEAVNLKIELDKPVENQSTELLQKKQEITAHIEDLNRVLNQRDVTEKTRARIEELKAEEKRLAQQISEAEGQRFLIEKFIKAKVNLLEGSINSRFKMVKFRLFETQINGGIAECCEALIGGVPFQDANHAAQVNGGIDIINVLSGHYGVMAPIFIDNRESVNKLIETGSQVINLLVSYDKELKVEVNK